MPATQEALSGQTFFLIKHFNLISNQTILKKIKTLQKYFIKFGYKSEAANA